MTIAIQAQPKLKQDVLYAVGQAGCFEDFLIW